MSPDVENDRAGDWERQGKGSFHWSRSKRPKVRTPSKRTGERAKLAHNDFQVNQTSDWWTGRMEVEGGSQPRI